VRNIKARNSFRLIGLSPFDAYLNDEPQEARVDKLRQGRASRSGEFQRRSLREMRGQVSDDIAGIIFHAVNEGGFAAPEDWQSQCIHPRCVDDDAAVVTKVALLVEYRYVQPAVIRSKPGGPHD